MGLTIAWATPLAGDVGGLAHDVSGMEVGVHGRASEGPQLVAGQTRAATTRR